MNQYIIAIDEGTSSCRAVLFDAQAKIVDVTQQEFTQIFPQSGWVEHDPEEIWQKQMEVLTELIKKNKLNGSDIAAIGITNQRETTLVWDKIPENQSITPLFGKINAQLVYVVVWLLMVGKTSSKQKLVW